MDTFTVMLGLTMFFFIAMGEFKKVGAYLWIAALFSLLFAFRMAEPGFYIVSAGVIIVLAFRTEFGNEDIRDSEDDD